MGRIRGGQISTCVTEKADRPGLLRHRFLGKRNVQAVCSSDREESAPGVFSDPRHHPSRYRYREKPRSSAERGNIHHGFAVPKTVSPEPWQSGSRFPFERVPHSRRNDGLSRVGSGSPHGHRHVRLQRYCYHGRSACAFAARIPCRLSASWARKTSAFNSTASYGAHGFEFHRTAQANKRILEIGSAFPENGKLTIQFGNQNAEATQKWLTSRKLSASLR